VGVVSVNEAGSRLRLLLAMSGRIGRADYETAFGGLLGAFPGAGPADADSRLLQSDWWRLFDDRWNDIVETAPRATRHRAVGRAYREAARLRAVKAAFSPEIEFSG